MISFLNNKFNSKRHILKAAALLVICAFFLSESAYAGGRRPPPKTKPPITQPPTYAPPTSAPPVTKPVTKPPSVGGSSNCITLTAVLKGGSPVSSGRKIYWNASAVNQVITPHDLPNGTASSNFSVSIPVKKGDIIKVKFSGSIFGNTYLSGIIGTGPVVANDSAWLGIPFGWSKHHMVYRPFLQQAFFRATGDGTARFYQEAYKSDLNKRNRDWPIRLTGRAATAEVIKGTVGYQ